MVFSFSWGDGYDPDVVEQLPSERSLVLAGEAVLPSNPVGNSAGVFSGRLVTYASAYVGQPAVAICSSANHELLLTR